MPPCDRRSLPLSTGTISLDEPLVVFLQEPLVIDHEIAGLVDDALHEVGMGHLVAHQETASVTQHPELKGDRCIVEDRQRHVLFTQSRGDDADSTKLGVEPAIGSGLEDDGEIDIAERSLVGRAIRPIEIDRDDIGIPPQNVDELVQLSRDVDQPPSLRSFRIMVHLQAESVELRSPGGLRAPKASDHTANPLGRHHR